MVTGPFSVIPVKTGGCNQLAPAASPAVNAVRLTVSVPVCSTGATSPFPLPLKSTGQRSGSGENNTMLHKPPCRQIEKQARRSLLIQLRGHCCK